MARLELNDDSAPAEPDTMVSRPRRWIPGIAVVLLLAAGPAAAEHEADHRYHIRGYVLDERERPVENLPVTARVAGGDTKRGRTDATGYYSLQMHLHDENIGQTITLRFGSEQAEIRMRAAAGDRSTPRIHVANFVGGRLTEDELARWRFPSWGYAVGGLVLFMGGAVLAERHRKRRLKRRRRAASARAPARGRRKRQRR